MAKIYTYFFTIVRIKFFLLPEILAGKRLYSHLPACPRVGEGVGGEVNASAVFIGFAGQQCKKL